MLFRSSERWHHIARDIYAVDISRPQTLYYSWIGHFFSTFMPSTLGTDITRIVYMRRRIGTATRSLVMVTVTDRIASLGGVAISSACGILFYFGEFTLAQSLLTLASVLVILKIICRYQPRITLFRQCFVLPSFYAFVLSLANFLLKAFSLYLIFDFFTGTAGVRDLYLGLGAQCIDTLAILPGNIGIGHILFGLLFTALERVNGAQVYNIYFVVKIMFKATGLIGWLRVKPKQEKQG